MAANDMKGKVVLITGATTGIGEATALKFAKLGAKLVITGRNVDGLKDTKAKCVKEGLQDKDVAIVTGDIRKEETLDLIVKTTLDSFGRVDVLFLSAGKVHHKVGLVTDPSTNESLDYHYEIFIKSPYLLTQKLAPELIKTKGAIVFNTTMCAHYVDPHLTSYSAIKAGEDHMVKLFALTFANKGVRVNSVRPGWVRTEVISDHDETCHFKPSENFRSLDPHTPLGSELTTSEEIANVVVFLATSPSSCLTGVQITCDKGYTMCHPAVDWKQI